jgi:uncharacterized RDD family membrane protein YckC
VTKLVVQTPEGVEIRQEIAGAGSRTAAASVDLLIFGFVALVAGLVLAIARRFGLGGPEEFLFGLFLGGVVLLGLAYPFLFHVLDHGQTPGKKLLGIRVLSADGSPARTVQHLLRSLILLIDVLPVPVPIGLLLAAVTPRHTRLGDLAAGTLVLRVAKPEGAVEPWPGERWSSLLQPRLALDARAAAALDARDVAFLRDVGLRRDFDPPAREALHARVADVYCAKLGIVRPPLCRPSDFVHELYLFAREKGPIAGPLAGP